MKEKRPDGFPLPSGRYGPSKAHLACQDGEPSFRSVSVAPSLLFVTGQTVSPGRVTLRCGSTFVFIFVVELFRHKHEFGVGFDPKLTGILA